LRRRGAVVVADRRRLVRLSRPAIHQARPNRCGVLRQRVRIAMPMLMIRLPRSIPLLWHWSAVRTWSRGWLLKPWTHRRRTAASWPWIRSYSCVGISSIHLWAHVLWHWTSRLMAIRWPTVSRRSTLLRRWRVAIRHLPRVIHGPSRHLLVGKWWLNRCAALLLRSIRLLLIGIVIVLLWSYLLSRNAKSKSMRDTTLLLGRLTITIWLLAGHDWYRWLRRGIVLRPIELLASLVQERRPSRRCTVKVGHLSLNFFFS
jgi:hypothetical protein